MGDQLLGFETSEFGKDLGTSSACRRCMYIKDRLLTLRCVMSLSIRSNSIFSHPTFSDPFKTHLPAFLLLPRRFLPSAPSCISPGLPDGHLPQPSVQEQRRWTALKSKSHSRGPAFEWPPKRPSYPWTTKPAPVFCRRPWRMGPLRAVSLVPLPLPFPRLSKAWCMGTTAKQYGGCHVTSSSSPPLTC